MSKNWRTITRNARRVWANYSFKDLPADIIVHCGSRSFSVSAIAVLASFYQNYSLITRTSSNLRKLRPDLPPSFARSSARPLIFFSSRGYFISYKGLASTHVQPLLFGQCSRCYENSRHSNLLFLVYGNSWMVCASSWSDASFSYSSSGRFLHCFAETRCVTTTWRQICSDRYC